MSSAAPPTFDELVASLSNLVGAARVDPRLKKLFQVRTKRLQLAEPRRADVSRLINDDPEIVPLLGLVVGLSQEALKNTLRVRLGSAGWVQLARKRPTDVVAMLDDEFQLLKLLAKERARHWEYGDILLERAGPRGRAGRAIGRGRALEDEVEKVVGKNGLNLPYKLRTYFIGIGGNRAPCDIAIPAGGDAMMIAIAVKGFNSTGSKLTDAAREVEAMAQARQPRQFIYAVVDGIGWHGRKSDFRRIYNLWISRRIDGLFTLAQLPNFHAELSKASRRLGLLV